MKPNFLIVAALVATTGILPALADVTSAQRMQMQAHLDKANALMKTSDPLQALGDVSAVLTMKLDSAYSVQALVLNGSIYEIINGSFGGPDVNDAIEEYTKAIEMAAKVNDGGPDFKKTFAEAYRYRGEAYSKLQNWKAAVANFDEALKINPNDVDSLIGRGEADSNFGLGLFAKIKEEPEVPPLDDFAAAIKLDPKSARAYVARGRFYQIGFITGESVKKALPEYEKATQVDPTYAEGWYWHATTLLLLHKAELEPQAKSDFDRAIALSPKAEYFAARAKFLAAQTQRNYPAIMADFTSAIKYDDANPARYTDRAAEQANLPNPDKAQMMADYSAAIELLKNKQKSLQLLAGFGSVDTAAVALNEVDLGRAQTNRGDLFWEDGKAREALADYNDALKNVPTSTEALAGRAQIMVAAGKPEMAIQEISARMAHIRHDKNEDTATKMFAVRGQAFLMTKHFDEALLDLNEAIKQDSMPGFKIYSKNADWYFWRALVWTNKGDNTHALADLNVAAKLNPAVIEKVKGTEFEKVLSPRDADASVLIENGDTAIFHKLKGDEWKAVGSPANAESEFDKAIALDPNYADAYNSRGLAWMELKNFDSAESDLNKAISLKADDPHFYINRSTLRLYQQRPAEAVADAKKATHLDIANAEFLDFLATAQQFNNEYAAAEDSLNSEFLIVSRDEEAGVRAKILLVRALQNHAPAQADLDALFAITGKDDLQYLLHATEAEIQRHPDVTALKDLQTAVAAQIQKSKAN
jgi:tetratricopeptide (TPR) repeat protein